MSLTPSSLLARLEELKKWQEKQQERLLQQHTSRTEPSNASSNYDTIEGLSMFDSSMDVNKNSSSRTDRPILVEKDLNLVIQRNKSSSPKSVEPPKECPNNNSTQRCDENNFVKPKKPFLKRGSGLVRYKMNPGDQKRPFNKIIRRKSTLKSNKSSDLDVIVSDNNVDVEITPLKAPDMNVKAVWFKVGSDNGLNKENVDFYNSDSIAKKTVLQINELAAQKHEGSISHVSMLNEREINAESKLPIMFQNTIQKSLEIPLMNDSFNDFEQINRKIIDKEPTEQSLYEKNLERELLIFEALEEKAFNSSFSSTNSSILHILSSTPSKIRDRKLGKDIIQKDVISERDEVNNKVEGEVINDNIDKLNSLESSVTSEDFQEKDFKDDEPWSDLNEFVRENSILSSASVSTDKSSEKEDTLVHENEEKPSKTEVDVSQEILVKKLKELDNEIQNFRKENTKLQKSKLEFEKEQRLFKKEKRAFEKHVLEEKINLEFYLEDEKKKLTKEKMVFERYVKDVQSKTTRKEREEIASLKEELANLKETAKLKESRNATSQARLRNQIKSFEKEILNLKEELDKLRKQNAKLTATQKLNKKSSDAKMLQEINKNLSKLTKDVKVSDQLRKLEDRIEKKKILRDSFECEGYTEGNKVLRHTGYDIKKKGVDKVMSLEDTEDDSFFYGKKKNASRSDDRMENYSNYEYYLSKDNRKDQDVIEKSVSNDEIEVIDDQSPNGTANKVEKDYEMMFGKNRVNETQSNASKANEVSKGISETILSDGSKEISYPNGNIKTISSDGNYICLKYFNGDIKETKLLEGTVRYYYAKNQSWQITTADGNEIIEFANGQVETKFKDGRQEIKFPNGIVRITKPDGSQTISYPDKTRVDIDNKGEKIILLPNGQKEIHNSEHMRREYPDGTVKILYPDGIQETRYGNGRIRIKDKDGNLLLDSHEDDT